MKLARLCKHDRFRPHGGCRCVTIVRQGQVEVGSWRNFGGEYEPDHWVDCTHDPFCEGGHVVGEDDDSSAGD